MAQSNCIRRAFEFAAVSNCLLSISLMIDAAFSKLEFAKLIENSRLNATIPSLILEERCGIFDFKYFKSAFSLKKRLRQCITDRV